MIPALPSDFSFIGFTATFNIFDFGKREKTIDERKMQVGLAEGELLLLRVVLGVFDAELQDGEEVVRVVRLGVQLLEGDHGAPVVGVRVYPGPYYRHW